MTSSRRSLWGIPRRIAETLEHTGKPIVSAWDLFRQMRQSYQDAGRNIPRPHDLEKIRFTLENARTIRPDPDYSRHYRVNAVPDRPADDIVCLIDRFCHISHLSAMQRWGLTDRQPDALMITRPDDAAVRKMAAAVMERDATEIPWAHRPQTSFKGPFRLNNIVHPDLVRQRPVRLHRSRQAGASVKDRGSFARVAAIGQTFLDTLRQPDLCGSMAHVLEVWDEHATGHLSDIITAIETASPAIKCRAGYIIEERLGVDDFRVKAWRVHAQRGGSRVLNPGRPYASEWSETWMISLNA